MKCPIHIRLTPEQIAKCKDYAVRFLASRQNGGANQKIADSMEYAVKWDDRDFDVMTVDAQRDGKAAEVAVALYLGKPLSCLSWDCDGPDSGADIEHEGLRIDVKCTGPRNRYMIWPVQKIDMYPGKKFDVFVSARGKERDWKIDGWMTKRKFYDVKSVAPANHKLVEGTWFIEIDGPHLVKDMNFFSFGADLL